MKAFLACDWWRHITGRVGGARTYPFPLHLQFAQRRREENVNTHTAQPHTHPSERINTNKYNTGNKTRVWKSFT